MKDVVVRSERTGDIERIAMVVEAAFTSPAEAKLIADIRRSELYRPTMALVALVDDEVVGHVMISTAHLDDGRVQRPIAMLSPLAVAPEHQRCGIGSALVRSVVDLADDAGDPLVVLEGDQRYYGRFGFVHSVQHGISMSLPDWAPPEAAQVRTLSGYDDAFRGQMVMPAAFDGLV